MLLVKLDTGFNIEVDFATPPFHKRLFAWIIDLLIFLAYLLLGGWMMRSTFGDAWGLKEWLTIIFCPSFYIIPCA